MKKLVVVALFFFFAGSLPGPAGVPVSQLVSEYIGGGLETAVTPTPQEAEFTDAFYPAGKEPDIVMPPGDYGAPETIKAQISDLFDGSTGDVRTQILVGGPARNPATRKALKHLKLEFPSDRGMEAYTLYAGPPAKGEGLLIILAGASAAADFWACQTLRQLTVRKDGIAYIRGASIRDWPAFPYRGNKQPRAWEHRFKANYSWFYPGANPELKAVFRQRGAWVNHVPKLDASEENITNLCAKAKAMCDSGVREFVLKYDDTELGMTPETEKRFGGDYYKAQAYFLTEMYNRIKGWNPANTVFFMPQVYWANALDVMEYAEGIKRAGGLPADMGLSFCGQEVMSERIPLDCVKTYQRLFGLTRQRAQIYDNWSRGGDLLPCAGRDPQLPEAVECLFNERGAGVPRITVYDYLWNPKAYDPERSLKLACRELAGRDPACYKALYDYVTTWNKERDRAGDLPRQAAVAQLRDSSAVFKAKLDALIPLLEKSPLAVEAKLAGELKGNVWEWGATAALARREAFQEFMIEHGYREIRARRAAEPMRIDGGLDEKTWSDADAQGAFSPLGGKTPPDALAPDADQTFVRVLYDETNLYVGVTMNFSKPPELPNWGKKHAPGTKANLGWRVPCVEINLDPDHDHKDFFQIQPNLQGWYSESHIEGWGSPLGSGPWWNSGMRFASHIEETKAVIEVSIPFSGLGATAKQGDRWGVQFCRNLNGYSSWSFMCDFLGFICPKQYGTLIFE